MTPARTGTPGYLPPELLPESGQAVPGHDVFSFGVLMLEVVVLWELWESNMFAHSVSHAMSKQASRRGNGQGEACDLQRSSRPIVVR